MDYKKVMNELKKKNEENLILLKELQKFINELIEVNNRVRIILERLKK